MKTKYLILIASLVIIFVMCKKKPTNNEFHSKSPIETQIDAPPNQVPILSGTIQSYVDQWKRLSCGYAILLNKPSTCNNVDLKIYINNLLASQHEEPVRNSIIYNYLKNLNFAFNFPSPTHNDLYDAINYQIVNNNPPTSITTWDQSFFNNFLYLDEMHFICTTIPMREFQISSGHSTKPALVMPDPETFGFPMIAYGYNNSTNAITEISVNDMDAYEDLIEGHSYYVFVLNWNVDFLSDKEITNGDCEGDFIIGDGNCDGNCGENTGNSPQDCGNHNINKVLYLKSFKINTDVANRKSQDPPENLHWEKWASGAYNPFYSAWTMHTSGRWSAIKKVPLNKVKLADVTRKRIRKNGSSVSRGTSIHIAGKERNTNDYAKISENYNPYSSFVYLFFWERDPLTADKQNSNVPLQYQNTTFDSIYWKGMRGNMTSGKHNSANWGYYMSNLVTVKPSIVSFRTLIEPIPTQWVPETLNGEPIMVYYYSPNEDDKVDFALFYYVNHR